MIFRTDAASLALWLGLAVLPAGAPAARVAPNASAMSKLDRLVIEDDIRQQLALYALLADGDGVEPKDLAKLADQLMTPDVQIDAYPADGGPPKHMSGRATITAPKPAPANQEPAYSRHFLVDTRFDDVTATTARTRTTAVQFVTPPPTTGANPAGGRAYSWVYHFDWTKTPDGWRIDRVALRNDK